MKKYLFISNSTKPTKDENESLSPIKLNSYTKPSLDAANRLGYQIWLGVNRANPEKIKVISNYKVNLYDSHTYRSIINLKDNFIAYSNAMKLLKSGDFDIIHCNTPVGGIIGRICGRIAKVPHIIYTAHGFHFYKGAPLINRTIFKWAEQIMARWTDVIITINREDYNAAKKFKLRDGGKIYYVPGVGIDTSKYEKIVTDKSAVREKLGLNKDDIICISTGDLVKNKNYLTAIQAIAMTANNKIQYLICGRGSEEKKLKALTHKLGIAHRVHFLGYREDVKELLQISDIFLFTSKREGLSRSLMEAMASGLPCVVSKIRGNVDLIDDSKGGYLINVNDIPAFSDKILTLARSEKIRKCMGRENIIKIKKFDISKVINDINNIYKDELNSKKE